MKSSAVNPSSARTRAQLFWNRDGQLAARTSEDYIAGSSGRPAAHEARRRRWISSVDVTGTAAVAGVVLDYPNVHFTDYVLMLKINDEWKVVNKIFHVEAASGQLRGW